MEETKKNKYNEKSFYGIFVLIYAALDIAAFLIMLLTKWSVLVDDEGDAFWGGFSFMTMGIVAALIHGIGPAVIWKHNGNLKQLWLFPSVIMLLGLAISPFSEGPSFVTGLALLIAPLGFPLYNCFAYNSDALSQIAMDIWNVAIAPATVYTLVILVTKWVCARPSYPAE